MPSHHDLLLTNGRVLTLDTRQPLAEAVVIRGDTIMAVGRASEAAALKGPGTRVIDCQGLALLPGFNDAHCHVLALAGSLSGVDCRPDRVSSISQLKRAIRQQARRTPPGGWVRGYGYDELSLAERRHPHRFDLDEAAPDHPVRLDHHSGHATVLNTRGLELAAIRRDTADPVDGVIQRDEASGEPTGLLLEMSSFLRHRLGQARDRSTLEAGVARANRLLLEYGITSVQDAGPGNDLARWAVFQRLVESEKLLPRVAMMAGAYHLKEFVSAGLRWGSGHHRLRLGHAKIMLTQTTGSLRPDVAELRELIATAHRAGFPAAVHAVEAEAVAAVARAFQEERPAGGGLAPDRIEHCSECPPELRAVVKQSGATVVTQPGFIYWNGDNYLERVSSALRPHLYSSGALASASVPVGFGSDAPVIDPNPWPAVYSAVTRQTRHGSWLPEREDDRWSQQVPVLEALRMYTGGGAWAEGAPERKGRIKPGQLADLVLVDADPTQVRPSELKDIKAVMTVIGGEISWEGGR